MVTTGGAMSPVPGDPVKIDAISRHIRRHLGPIALVFHELVSEHVHIDVHWVEPTRRYPHHVFITSGMSERPMQAPRGAEAQRYAELTISLPATWPVDAGNFEDDANRWPVRLLKELARLPHARATWLWADHLVLYKACRCPFHASTRQNSVVLAPSRVLPSPLKLRQSGGVTPIHFFSVIPLYDEEYNYCVGRGVASLYARLERAGISEAVQPTRPSVCSRKGWGGAASPP